MDGRDIFIDKFEKNFNLSRNKIEIENKLANHHNILEEFKKNGIVDLFISRKKNNIFRENGLTSQDASNLSKTAKQAYIAIQKAALYNLTNPIEAQNWLNTIATYLNDYNINLESYIHFGVPEISNPFEEILKELEEQKQQEKKAELEKKKEIKEVLLKALVITAPQYEQKFHQREVLSNIELSCMTGIFYCIEHDKEKEEALKELYQYFKWCKKREKLYPIPYRIAMQYYAECLYHNKKYAQCKQICIEALEELSFTSKLENRAEFFTLKAKAQEKIGFLNEEEKKQCIKDFLTAYYVIAFYDGEAQAEKLKIYIKENYTWQFIE